jgi:hypothetical protein
MSPQSGGALPQLRELHEKLRSLECSIENEIMRRQRQLRRTETGSRKKVSRRQEKPAA